MTERVLAIAPLRRRFLIVHNPTAGWRRASKLDRVRRHLVRLGCTVVVRATQARGDAESIVRATSRTEYDAVAIAGGDGTMNEAINGLLDENLPLAIIPLGTANVLAAEIGMPSGARDIARVIAHGPTRSIHVGQANGRRFVMMAGVGFDAHVVSRIRPKMKRALGKAAYVVETLLALARFPFPTYRVVLDGRAFEAASLVVANGRYYGGRFVCAPDARLDRGSFEVCLFGRAGAWNAVRYATALVLGRLQHLRDVAVIRAENVIVVGNDAEPVQGDGDIVAHLPLEAETGTRIGLVVPA